MSHITEFLLKIGLSAALLLGFGILQVWFYRVLFDTARGLLRSFLISMIVNIAAMFLFNSVLFGDEVAIANLVATFAVAMFPTVLQVEKIIAILKNEPKISILDSIKDNKGSMAGIYGNKKTKA